MNELQNTSLEFTNNEFKLLELFKNLLKNKFTFLIISAFLFISYLFVLLFVTTFKTDSTSIILPLITTNEKLSSEIELDNLITYPSISKALEESQLSDQVEAKEIKPFLSLMRGENNINNLADYFSTKHVANLSREFGIQPELIEGLSKEIYSQRDQYVQLILKSSKLNISNVEGRIFLSELSKTINENVALMYDVTGKSLKKVSPFSENEITISNDSVIGLYYKYIQINDAVTELKEKYSLYAKDLNIYDYEMLIQQTRYKVYQIINYKTEFFDKIYDNQLVKVDLLNKRIEGINDVLNLIDYGKNGVFAEDEYQSSDPLAMADIGQLASGGGSAGSSGYITDIIGIGEKLGFVNYKKQQLDERKVLHEQLVDARANLMSLENSSKRTADISINEVEALFSKSVAALNKLSYGVNDYIDAIDSVRTAGNYFEPISGPYIDHTSMFPINLRILLLLGIFFSVIISFLIISIRHIFKN